MNLGPEIEVSQTTYDWTGRLIGILENFLPLRLKVHQSNDQLKAGEIFLFNHFTRFETFIPQYLIYRETGAICRTVASSQFFAEESPFASYLLKIGAVPNNHPRLLPLLAEEILRGRKVIIFPEGGMVKDRRVLDGKGRYSIFSPTAGKNRRHHRGAAILALVLDAFKTAVLEAERTGNLGRLQAWAESLRLPDVETLIGVARRPTLIVPATITFYPIRVSDNILRKMAEAVSRGLNPQLSEEFLIEGNILLKDTDMDVRLGDPVRPADFWSRWERSLVARLAGDTGPLDAIFRLSPNAGSLKDRLAAVCVRRRALQVRDESMRRMYAGVHVNLSHLASLMMLKHVAKKETDVDPILFHKALYLAVKNVQRESAIHLHRSLKNPAAYSGILRGRCEGLEQFFRTIASMNLVARDSGRYCLLPKLSQEFAFDGIRLENLVAVYANEVAPIRGVNGSVTKAMKEALKLSDRALAELWFDDELVAYALDKQRFSKPRHGQINKQETATESGEPFLLLPDRAEGLGVVLVHGFGASPAEVRPFGEKLRALGYPVIGARLKGHGTSPWDLRERSWEDWLESVRGSCAIMSALTRRVCIVGFSAGGALALRFAADCPDGIVGVAAVSVPMKFRDRNMIFAPLVHGANRLVRWVSSWEGVMPFHPRDSEHPHINYRHVPVRGLYELQCLAHELEDRLSGVRCPVLLIQGNDDPVVDPKGADLIYRMLGASEKTLVTVAATRHGILYENIGDTQERIISFLAALSSSGPQAPHAGCRQDGQPL